MSVAGADHGAARERTALAWRRTSLAFAANGILLARSHDVWIAVAAFIVLAFAAGIATMAARAFRSNEIHGFLVARERRDRVFVIATVAVSAIDLCAIARWHT